MKKNNTGKRGPQEAASQNLQPDKVGWIRKFCGKGIFREIWRNRFVVLRGDQLFICEKEVKELGRADEVLDLCHFDRCEEILKNKSRSKKNLSKFKLQRSHTCVPELVFLAVSPEEKELWISVINGSIIRAKNRILDEVTSDESQLLHLTRHRAKIPHNRRLPTRGHLLAVASSCSSDGTLTLDLIQEEDIPFCRVSVCEDLELDRSPDCPRSRTNGALFPRTTEACGKSRSLPREVVVEWEQTTTEKNRCTSMDQILSHSDTETTKNRTVVMPHPQPLTLRPQTSAPPIDLLQELIGQKLRRTEQLLAEVRVEEEKELSESEKLLKEAAAAWSHAHEVLEEVKELRTLYQQLNSSSSITVSNNDNKSPM
ncbi:hypothetical protein JOB18_019698 [Solea senegalensis]|uniref:PH domain-containing protein n=1 Tax=Solea senegalensis TaxID=28829 RepID=A0AAV6PUH3_SOLSE|nr:pleckstrin homology domain-containing family O member 1b [Solea senegalensis]KAG7474905.1 hypothetical protein JOB18_019698 [Solea senegalensis]